MKSKHPLKNKFLLILVAPLTNGASKLSAINNHANL